MTWVKKNLFILIAAVVSLGLLVYAGFFVKSKMDEDAAVAATLDESAGKFKDLLTRKVHPGNEKQNNIKAAQEELVKMRSFMDELREYIKGSAPTTNLNNQVFRAMLDTSIAELRRSAEQANVTLPNTNYWFTFSNYKSTVDFKNDVQGLAAELADIKAMMRVLYDARVHAIINLRRVGATDTEYGSATELISGRQPKTNDWAVTTGYEVTFQGFSSELARVMEGMANAKECFVVKSLGVAQAPEEKSKQVQPMPVMPMYRDPRMGGYGGGYGGMGGGPYGPYGRPGMQQPMMQAPVAAAQPRAGGMQLQRVLDEAKLRFTLQVDSIRLKPKAQAPGAAQPRTQVTKAADGQAPAAPGAPAAPTAPATKTAAAQ